MNNLEERLARLECDLVSLKERKREDEEVLLLW